MFYSKESKKKEEKMLEIVQVYGHKLHKTLIKNQTSIPRKKHRISPIKALIPLLLPEFPILHAQTLVFNRDPLDYPKIK